MSTNNPERPIPNSYWVRSGQFAAGEYPGAKYAEDAAAKLRDLLDSGIDHFIDLTEAREPWEPYNHIVKREGSYLGKDVQWERHPIRDMSVPRNAEQMKAILDAIDDALDSGETVYVHCYGGVGRTGTVVGCWLVRHGLTGDEALAQIAEWWKGVEKSWRIPQSPEMPAQFEYVLSWEEAQCEETST